MGEVEIGGAKNAALGILAAAIMTDETVVIDNLPDKDIEIPDKPEYRNVSYAIGVNGSSMELHFKMETFSSLKLHKKSKLETSASSRSTMNAL